MKAIFLGTGVERSYHFLESTDKTSEIIESLHECTGLQVEVVDLEPNFLLGPALGIHSDIIKQHILYFEGVPITEFPVISKADR